MVFQRDYNFNVLSNVWGKKKLIEESEQVSQVLCPGPVRKLQLGW